MNWCGMQQPLKVLLLVRPVLEAHANIMVSVKKQPLQLATLASALLASVEMTAVKQVNHATQVRKELAK